MMRRETRDRASGSRIRPGRALLMAGVMAAGLCPRPSAASPAVPTDARMTAERVMAVRTASDPTLAPDGRALTFTLTRPRRADEGAGAAVSEVWRIDRPCRPDAGAPVQLGGASSANARWAPDGSRIAWLEPDRDGVVQLMLQDAAGRTTRQATALTAGATAFAWSPDGSAIALAATDGPTAAEQADRLAGRDWIVVGRDRKPVRLHVLDLKTGATRAATGTDISVFAFDWAPDSQRLVVAAGPTPNFDDQLLNQRLYVVERTGGAVRNLGRTTRSPIASPRWSPDGRQIAWLSGSADNDPYPGIVHVTDVASGAHRALTTDFSGSATGLSWLPGAAPTILFPAIEGQGIRWWRLDPSTGRRSVLADPSFVSKEVPAFTGDGRVAVVAGHSPQHPEEIFCFDSRRLRFTRQTRLNPGLDAVALGAQEEIRWRSTDGLEIEGVLIKPPGFDPGRRYPLVVYVHGGSESAQLNGWYGSWEDFGQLLAASDKLVLYPNYRGSLGRGTAFLKGEHDDVMGRSFDDIVSGADHLAAIGLADRSRTGIAGYSWGGLAAAWGATHGSRHFKAAVVMAGMSNWITHSGTSNSRVHDQVAHWNRMLYDRNFELFLQRSPVAQIDKAATPTLILHGEQDSAVPLAQAWELHSALVWKGVPVEFVIYPREEHELTESAHRLHFLEATRDWFDKWLAAGAAAE